MEIWLAQELGPGTAAHDEDEHIEVVRMPLARALEMAAEGEIRDAKSLAALWRLKVHLDSEGLPEEAG